VSPELIDLQPTTAGADIWALGITVLELYNGVPPYFELVI